VADSRNGQSRRMKTVRDVSAGGVAFRSGPDGIEVALVGRLEPERWALPKGTPTRGESMEQAALREVTEETGLHVRLVRPLLDIDYWFVLHGIRHFKTVHFYLMEAIGGDVSLHDAEYDVVKWFPLDEASHHLSYPNEREVLARAEAELAEVGDGRWRLGARNRSASNSQSPIPNS
jgi:8-oxo-dGTP pyrophosphatase MutT (NUDIX family)